MRGGALSATVNLPGQASDIANPSNPAPDFTGVLNIKDFQLINQPLISRLFAAGSLTGLGDLMGSDGISIDEWNFPFTSKNNVIGVNGARATGRAICATSDGYIDRPHGTLALKGSLVPACGVNSLISNIPLLGDLLASKKGEGVLSATYSATGNMEQPQISTNPLSMLAPGISAASSRAISRPRKMLRLIWSLRLAATLRMPRSPRPPRRRPRRKAPTKPASPVRAFSCRSRA